MTQARRTLISLGETPYYHCITRCVRRAFLCGNDPVSQKCFDHRKVWLVERFKSLSTIFAIDICAYAVMSNHYHLVLYVDAAKADQWSDDEVITRWKALFPVSAQNVEDQLASTDSPAVREHFQEQLQEWRSRLKDISWFMKCLNEYIARRSNKEDNCKGHFWEARFKSQALLDEKALLCCMAYVDLNPVRAGMANTPEDSDFTSIQERLVDYAKGFEKTKQSRQQQRLLRHYHQYYEKKCISKGRKPAHQDQAATFSLKPFAGSTRIPLALALPYTQQDYFQLVDATGRVIRQDKRGAIPSHLPALVARMGMEEKNWLASAQGFLAQYASVAGDLEALRGYEDRGSLKGVKGVGIERIRAA